MLAIVCVSAKLCPPPAYPLSFPRMTWRGNDFLPHVNVRHRADAVKSIQKPHWPGSKVVGKDGSELILIPSSRARMKTWYKVTLGSCSSSRSDRTRTSSFHSANAPVVV